MKKNNSAPKGSLSGQAPRKGNTQPASNHPLRTKIYEVGMTKPAASLEVWFDNGLVFTPASVERDTEEHVSGSAMLPVGYEGCSHDSVCLECKQNGITIWPARIDLADDGWQAVEPARPWTIYHYTHEYSFNVFAKMFLRGVNNEEEEEAAVGHLAQPTEIRKAMFAQLQADYQERTPAPAAHNPNGEPELVLLEPKMFSLKERIVTDLFHKADLNGFSLTHGNRWGDFADYCIAFRVPQSCCINVPGASEEEGSSMIKLSREALASLNRRALNKLEAVKAVKQKDAAKRKADMKKAAQNRNACLRFLCGATAQAPEFWDEEEEDTGQEEEKKTKKQDLDTYKKKMMNEWTKEHFLTVTKRKEVDRKNIEEQKKAEADKRKQDAREAAEKRAAAKKGVTFKVLDASGREVSKNGEKNNNVEQSATSNSKVGGLISGTFGSAAPKEGSDAQSKESQEHLAMFYELKRRDIEEKETVSAADSKIKKRGGRQNTNASTSAAAKPRATPSTHVKLQS